MLKSNEIAAESIKAMHKVSCFYHPESAAVGRCDRCGQPICSTCTNITISYLTRASQRLCRICLAKSETKTIALFIGIFVPFVLIASIGWAFFAISPISGWLYLLAVPAISALMALRYYRGKIRKIEAAVR
jgi:hypothetical protein